MTVKNKRQPKKNHKSKSTLLLVGTALFLLWPLIGGYFGAQVFFCGIMDGVCENRNNLQEAFALVPTMIGGFLLAGGIAQKLKYRHGVKVAIGLCLAIVFFMLTYVLTFLGYFISASLLSIGGQ